MIVPFRATQSQFLMWLRRRPRRAGNNLFQFDGNCLFPARLATDRVVNLIGLFESHECPSGRIRCRREPNDRAVTADLIAEFRCHAVTATSTDMSLNASLAPTKLPTIGVDCQMARVTATGIRLRPPTLRLVGSKVIHPAPCK
jgi:hypothetical protein